MPQKQIITGQSVSPTKKARAIELRHDQTPAERKLWARLRGNQLDGYHFRRQQVIEPYIIDFYCHQAALVVEVDGGIHREQQESDHMRDRNLQARGLRIIRFSNSDVIHNLEGVLQEILLTCRLVKVEIANQEAAKS